MIPGLDGRDFWSYDNGLSQQWTSKKAAEWPERFPTLKKVFPSAMALRTPRGQGTLSSVQDALLTSSVSQTQRHKQLNQPVTLSALIHKLEDLPADETTHLMSLLPGYIETQKDQKKKHEFIAMDCEMVRSIIPKGMHIKTHSGV